MRSWRLIDIVFPLCLFSFVAVGVKYFDVIFTTNMRWAFLAVLAVVLFQRGSLFDAYRSRFGAPLAIYAIWCICTTAWSIVPELSFLKSLAFVATSTVFLAAGRAWAERGSPRGTFTFLAPVLAVALFAGFFDRGRAIEMGNVEIYKGLTGNPNYLGMLEAQAMPLGFWLVFQNWKQPLWRYASIGLVALLGLALWLAGSRSAILGVLCVAVGAFAALTSNRRLLGFGLAAAAVAAVLVLVPTVQHSISTRVINKGQTEEGGVFYSRRNVWAESYANAQQGGLLGAGYGATVGKTDLSVKGRGLTSFGYGREKGNSQLAIWEETGIVGLIFYSMLLVAAATDIVLAWRRTALPAARMQLGLLLGAIVGFFAQSVFEAWWVAPGSPEFAYFFAILGVASGLAHRITEDSEQAAQLRRANRSRVGRPIAMGAGR